jgi:hypothetical protein
MGVNKRDPSQGASLHGAGMECPCGSESANCRNAPRLRSILPVTGRTFLLECSGKTMKRVRCSLPHPREICSGSIGSGAGVKCGCRAEPDVFQGSVERMKHSRELGSRVREGAERVKNSPEPSVVRVRLGTELPPPGTEPIRHDRKTVRIGTAGLGGKTHALLSRTSDSVRSQG